MVFIHQTSLPQGVGEAHRSAQPLGVDTQANPQTSQSIAPKLSNSSLEVTEIPHCEINIRDGNLASGAWVHIPASPLCDLGQII